MKLTVYPSGKGDCLLLESAGKRMLIDGGVSDSFRSEVLPDLAKSAKRPIDCMYLSHIDDDHIGGLLALVDAIYEWRVFHYRKGKKPAPKTPGDPRPPEVLKVWHNAFSAQLGENAKPVVAALAESRVILSGAQPSEPLEQAVADFFENLAESTKQSLQLSYRVGAGELGIDVNPEYKGDLMFVRKGVPKLKLGKVEFSVIGPFAEDLDKLRREWNQWLREHKDTVVTVRKRAKADADKLITSADDFLQPLQMEAAEFLALAMKKIGNRTKVTTPNLASLMLLAEEGTKTILLTGDGHGGDVLKGLEARKKLDANGKIHVNVLKVQHHGSEHNMTDDFLSAVTADHYVFCGNGFATNPEETVVEKLVQARAGDKRPFTFWFNSTPKSAHYHAQMLKVKKLTDRLVKEQKGRMKAVFNDQKFAVPF